MEARETNDSRGFEPEQGRDGAGRSAAEPGQFAAGPEDVGPIAWLADIESPEASLPPWVLAKIDRTIDRYRGRWTDQQTATFRRQMAWTLATHPRVRRLVEIVESARGAPGSGAARGART